MPTLGLRTLQNMVIGLMLVVVLVLSVMTVYVVHEFTANEARSRAHFGYLACVISNPNPISRATITACERSNPT